MIGWSLSSFTTDTTSELDILWHNSDTLGVDSAQVGVLKQTNKVGFTGLLESSNGCRLEPKIGFEILSNFSDETLEGELSDQKLSRLLVSSDFSEGNSSRSVPMWLLDSSS